MSVNVGQAIGYLDLDTSKFTSGFQSALHDLKTFQDESATAGDKIAALGSAFQGAGKTLTTNVTLPIVGVGTAATTIAANFESSMSQVQAISGATGEDFERLSDKAKQMGATTKFSASESAQAMTYMAMAGWKTEDMIDGIDGIIQLAAASGEDLATTSDIVTDALTAFGLTAKDSSQFADILAAASANANTNVAMLGESFKYVAPVAGALKYSAEDTSIALGLMANSGIKASQAGTALRTLMTNMAKPTDNMALAMETLGVSLTDAEGNMQSLMDIMKQLRVGFKGATLSQEEYAKKTQEVFDAHARGAMNDKAFAAELKKLKLQYEGVSDAEQAELAAMLAGKEGMSGLLAIVNSTEEDFQKLTGAIYEANGSAKDMADTQLNNLQGRMTILKSALEGLSISFGELLLPAITKVTEWVTKLVDWLNSLDEGTKERIVQIAALAAAIGPVLLLIGKLISVVTTVINVFKILKPAIAAVNAVLAANPIGIVIVAIAGLVAALVTLYNKNEAFRDFVDTAWAKIKDTISGVVSIITVFFTQTIPGAIDIMSSWFRSLPGVIDEIVRPFAQLPAKLFEIGKNLLLGLVDGISSVVAEVIAKVKNTCANILSSIKSAFGIHSPSKETFEMGTMLMKGLTEGMENSLGKVKKQTEIVADTVAKTFEKVLPEARMVSIGSDIIGNSYAQDISSVRRNPNDSSASVTQTQSNTFVFNSPKAIVPTVAAKLLKQTAQQISMGIK